MRSSGDATISSCDESSCAGSVTVTVSGSLMAYASTARTVRRTSVAETRTTSDVASLGPMIAFQPDGSFCSERMPARSAARSTSTNGAVLTFVPLAAWAPNATMPPASLEAARLSSVALSAEAFHSKKGMKESPLSEIVSSIEELPPLRLSSDRLWSSEPESEARPAEGKMRTVLFESNPWLDRTAPGGMLNRICCAERMSKPAIWGISMLRRVASSTVIELAESTPTLAESHPPGCGTTACKPSTKACPAALASSPSAQASSARVTSMVQGSNERAGACRTRGAARRASRAAGVPRRGSSRAPRTARRRRP